MKRLLIIGAGGHGRAVAEAVTLIGELQLVGFLDDAEGGIKGMAGVPVLGTTSGLEDWRGRTDVAIVAIGNNCVRERLHQRLREEFELISVIHPRAIVAPSALVGAGSAIMAGAVVGTEARLGEGVIVNCGAVVDHHCVVEDFGHVGTNASMAGTSLLGRGAWMQAGSSLGYGVRIASGDVLQPGAGRVRSGDSHSV